MHISKPPSSWIIPIENDNLLFNKLFHNFDVDDIVFKIILSPNKYKTYTKKKCIQIAKNIALDLLNLYGKNNKQIKILGIIKCSEESIFLNLSSIFIAAHYSIIFEELDVLAIAQRINVYRPDIIICRPVLLEKVKKALNITGLNNIHIKVLSKKYIKSKEDIKEDLAPFYYKKDYDLLTLFTSGSTGIPKSIIHGHQNYTNYAKITSEKYFKLKKNLTFFTATDAAWINGQTYAFYGPLLVGAPTVISENLTNLSNPENLCKAFEELEVNIFYTSVTLLRLLRTNSDNIQNINYKNIERIGSCGEPLADEVGRWAIKFFNPKSKIIVNTYFQTETGGILTAPKDVTKSIEDYSNVGKPIDELKIVPAKDILSKKVLLDQNLVEDELLVLNSWGGIFRKVLSDKPSNYFTKEGYFRLHDVGYIDSEGILFIGGRSDDVINVAGHRISTSEIEHVVLSFKNIRESCAIGIPDSTFGKRIILFISTTGQQITKEEKGFKLEVINKIKNELSDYHIPSKIFIYKDLPKTKSGKIMRRIMRNLAESFSIDKNQDVSTFSDKDEFNASRICFFDNYIDSIISNRVLIKNKLLNLPTNIIFVLIEWLLRYEDSKKIDKLIIVFHKKNIFISQEIIFEDYDSLLTLKEKLLNIFPEKNIEINFRISIAFSYREIIQTRLAFKFNQRHLIFGSEDLYFSTYSINLTKGINLFMHKLFKDNQVSKEQKYLFDEEEIKKNIDIYKCCRCSSTLSEMKKQRGDKVYLVPCISDKEKNLFVCDLCLGGW